MSLPFQTPGALDVLPMCPAEGGACLEPSFPTSLGRLVCTAGHEWEAVPQAERRKAADPVGALWRDADAQVEAWLRRIASAP